MDATWAEEPLQSTRAVDSHRRANQTQISLQRLHLRNLLCIKHLLVIYGVLSICCAFCSSMTKD